MIKIRILSIKLNMFMHILYIATFELSVKMKSQITYSHNSGLSKYPCPISDYNVMFLSETNSSNVYFFNREPLIMEKGSSMYIVLV